MAIRDHVQRVHKLRGHVTTVDPSQRIVEVATADGRAHRVYITDIAGGGFVWPQEGEDWSIYEENGMWVLGSKFLNQDEAAEFEALQPGDVYPPRFTVVGTPSDGDIIVWDTTTNTWIVRPGGGGGPALANIDFNGHKGINAADPDVAQDVATKHYVDNIGSLTQTPATGVMARRTADTTIPNPSGIVPWNTEDYDTDAFHDNTANPTRLTVPPGKAGKYAITANVSVSNANTSGVRNVSIMKNGSGTGIEAAVPVVASDSTRISVSGILDLAAGDYIEINLFHNAGVALTVQSAWSQVSMARVPGNNAVIVGPQVPAIGARATVGPGGTQAIAVSGSAHVAFPGEDFDTDSIHSTTVNNSRMTINTAGVYEIDAWLKWNVGTGGFTYISLLKNGASVGPIGENSATGGHMDISATLSLVPGDYIEIAVANTTAGGLTVDQAALSVARIPGAQGAALGITTVLPANPVDQQECFYKTPSGEVWHCKYDANWTTTASKWAVLSGPPLFAEVETNQSCNSDGVIRDLATIGPSVVLPLNGDFDFEYGAAASANNGGAGAPEGYCYLNVNGTTDTLTLCPIVGVNSVSSGTQSGARYKRKTALIGGQTVKLVYQGNNTGGSLAISRRWITCRPVRVG